MMVDCSTHTPTCNTKAPVAVSLVRTWFNDACPVGSWSE